MRQRAPDVVLQVGLGTAFKGNIKETPKSVPALKNSYWYITRTYPAPLDLPCDTGIPPPISQLCLHFSQLSPELREEAS